MYGGSQSNMVLPDRNTFVYAAENPGTVLGGLSVTPGITNANFQSMLEIVCVFSDSFELYNQNGQLIEKDENQLQPDNYYIVTNGRYLLFFHHQESLTPNRFYHSHRGRPATSSERGENWYPHYHVPGCRACTRRRLHYNP